MKYPLYDTSGEYVFIVQEGTDAQPKYTQVTFTDLKDIPDDFDYLHLIKFVGNIPPAPHTLEQHEQIALLEKEFKRYLNKEYLK